MKHCKLYCTVNDVHKNSICRAQWLPGACQKKGMLVHTMQQIVHNLEKSVINIT